MVRETVGGTVGETVVGRMGGETVGGLGETMNEAMGVTVVGRIGETVVGRIGETVAETVGLTTAEPVAPFELAVFWSCCCAWSIWLLKNSYTNLKCGSRPGRGVDLRLCGFKPMIWAR